MATPKKPQDRYRDKYERAVERELGELRKQVQLLRNDVEFYRGKVERLELSLFADTSVGSRYVRRSDEAQSKPAVTGAKVEVPKPVRFGDIKKQWGTMTEKEQEAALEKQDLQVSEVTQ